LVEKECGEGGGGVGVGGGGGGGGGGGIEMLLSVYNYANC